MQYVLEKAVWITQKYRQISTIVIANIFYTPTHNVNANH
jgi:hypothetical protein